MRDLSIVCFYLNLSTDLSVVILKSASPSSDVVGGGHSQAQQASKGSGGRGRGAATPRVFSIDFISA